MLLSGPLTDFNINCKVSRDEETAKTRPRFGVAISHCEVSLIKGNGLSGNFECVFSVVFSARVIATAEQMLKQLRQVEGCFYSRSAPSSNLVIAHQSCGQSLKLVFIVWLLKAVVGFLRGTVACGGSTSCECKQPQNRFVLTITLCQVGKGCGQGQMHIHVSAQNNSSWLF